MVQLLLSNSAELEIKDSMGWTPLMVACEFQISTFNSACDQSLELRCGAEANTGTDADTGYRRIRTLRRCH